MKMTDFESLYNRLLKNAVDGREQDLSDSDEKHLDDWPQRKGDRHLQR